MKKLLWICSILLILQHSYSQQSRFVKYLVDSMPDKYPAKLNLPLSEGCFAAERIAISNNGKELYFSERNGYNPDSKANIVKLTYSNKKWGKRQIVFKDSCGAAALSPNDKTLYFQYDHPTHPKGLLSFKTKTGWSAPVSFSKTIKGSHYLQSVKSGKYYFSEIEVEKNTKRDIYCATITATDTIIDTLGFGKIANILGDFYISRDESYIILIMEKKDNKENYPFFKDLDFFISFKNRDREEWTKPLNMGKSINGACYSWKWGQYVTDDNKYLFFTSWENGKREAVYVIEFEELLNAYKNELN